MKKILTTNHKNKHEHIWDWGLVPGPRFRFVGLVWFVVKIIFISSSPVWAQDELKPASFAGAMVYSGREGSLLKLEIPIEVYQGLRQPDLGDIRIFDASGKLVPFMIRDKPKEIFIPVPEEVPFFLWNGGRENNLPAGTDIEINTSGGVVRIKNQNAASGNLPVYLVDCSLLKYPPSGLRVRIETQENFNTPVTIHFSTDLSGWKEFDKRQVLAFFGGRAQDALELPWNTGFRYLLLSFTREAPPPRNITAFFMQQEKESEYHELTIHGRKSSDGKKVNYETSSFIPAESVDFVLEEADSIPVLVKNRYSKDNEWSIRARGTIFRYSSAGSIVKSEPFKIASQAPFWELETTGELLFSSSPECVIRWKPRELIFPARGKGPWTLAYGSAASDPIKAGELLPLGGREEFETAVFTGEKRYEKKDLSSPVKHKFRIFIPWAFLGAAVITLSLLALHIAKSMRKYYHIDKEKQ